MARNTRNKGFYSDPEKLGGRGGGGRSRSHTKKNNKALDKEIKTEKKVAAAKKKAGGTSKTMYDHAGKNPKKPQATKKAAPSKKAASSYKTKARTGRPSGGDAKGVRHTAEAKKPGKGAKTESFKKITTTQIKRKAAAKKAADKYKRK